MLRKATGAEDLGGNLNQRDTVKSGETRSVACRFERR